MTLDESDLTQLRDFINAVNQASAATGVTVVDGDLVINDSNVGTLSSDGSDHHLVTE